MVAHAKLFDSALAQVTKVLSEDAAFYNSVECHMFHQNKGCCMAAIIFTTVLIANKDNRNGETMTKNNNNSNSNYYKQI